MFLRNIFSWFTYLHDHTHSRESHPKKKAQALMRGISYLHARSINALRFHETLPETPVQAKPALETTEGKQEDMLACHLALHRVTEAISSLLRDPECAYIVSSRSLTTDTKHLLRIHVSTRVGAASNSGAQRNHQREVIVAVAMS